MGDGHGAVLAQQQLRHRLADEVGAADDHRVLAGEVADEIAQQHQAAERRAAHRPRQADLQLADARRA